MKPGLYAKILERSDGACEACLGGFGAHFPLTPEADHFEGRSRSEEESTVWLIHAICHRDKHAGKPSAAYWLQRFIAFQKRHGFDSTKAEKHLSWHQTRDGFGRGA